MRTQLIRLCALVLVLTMTFQVFAIPGVATETENPFVADLTTAETESVETETITQSATEETLSPTVPEETVSATESEETLPPTVPEETVSATEPEETLSSTEPEETTPVTEPEETAPNEPQYGIDVSPEHADNSPLEESEAWDISKFSSSSEAPRSNDINRYTVLLLDVESAFEMRYNGKIIYEVKTPLATIKQAANKFIEQVQHANGNNYVAVVAFASNAVIKIPFSMDTELLSDCVNSLKIGDFAANFNDALLKADTLLSEIDDEKAIKNVVVFGQGVNMAGSHSTSGIYSEEDCSWYRINTGIYIYEYSNATYKTAQSMMEKYNLYSIGLFQNFDSVPQEGQSLLDFARRFSRDIQNKGYQEVDDIDELEFAFGEIADTIVSQRGEFRYAGSFDEDYDATAEYVYSDSYFYDDAERYNESLATMSLCLELSTWSSHEHDGDWPNKTINVEHLLTGCDRDICIDDPGLGFKDFRRNSFWDAAPTKDSIGVVCANKQIMDDGKPYFLVPVVIRGGGYGSEWASNFKVGISGNHSGFEEARDNTLTFLYSYLEDLVASNGGEAIDIKLWIVGYSRGGATANMVAGKICEGYSFPEGINPVSWNNVFCYAFETPQGVYGDTYLLYPNIKNIVGVADIVPRVAPTAWDFHRYGLVKTTPNEKLYGEEFQSALEAMQYQYRLLGGSVSDYGIPEKVSLYSLQVDWKSILPGGKPFAQFVPYDPMYTEDVLDDSFDYLAEEVIGSRAYYYINMQGGLRDVLGILMHYDGAGEGAYQKILELFNKDTLLEIVSPMISFNPFYTYAERRADVTRNLTTFVGNALVDVGQASLLAASLVDIIDNLLDDVCDDLYHWDTSSFDLVVRLISYFSQAGFQPHLPEVVMAWLRSTDPNYTSDPTQLPGTNASRVMRINCPVNVYVYNKTGQLVGSIVNDVPGNETSLRTYVNYNGEKVIWLPGDMEYTVTIEPTETGTMSISIGEENVASGESVRLQNYYDIPIALGENLTAAIPAISASESVEASDVVYRVTDAEAKVINPDEETTDRSKANECFNVELSIEGNGGSVNGAGKYTNGSFAKVEVSELVSGSFLGWYDGDTCVSTDLVYRFAVRKDVTLVAKFREVPLYEVTYSATDGGEVLCPTGEYVAGTTIFLEAIPWEGYEFDHWSANGITFQDATSPATSFVMEASDVKITAYWKKLLQDVPVESVMLEQEYLAMKVGGTAQLQADIKPVELTELLSWSMENDDETVASVDENGVVTANAVGTVYVIATVTSGETELSARCRIDVAAKDIDEPEKIRLDGVQLNATKAMVELYSTDYADLEILLKLPQNYSMSTMSESQAGVQDNGIAIYSARFTDEAMAELFEISILDDRRIQIVPTDYAVENPKQVKSKYTGTITVNVQGEEYETGKLTLTVKKTKPKVKATVAAFNAFYSGQSQQITVTGGTPTTIYENDAKNTAKTTAIPSWLDLEEGILTLNNKAQKKSVSGKAYLVVETEEWRIPAEVTLSVKNAYKVPGVKLAASSVTVTNRKEASSVELQLLCSNKADVLKDLGITEITAPEGYTVESFNTETGTFTLTAENGFKSGKVTLKVSYGSVTKSLALTVKAQAVKLKMSASKVTLNKDLEDAASVTVSVLTGGYALTEPVLIFDDSKLGVWYFDGTLYVSLADGAQYGKTYPVTIRAYEGAPAVKLSVAVPKKTAAVKSTIKATGTLDVIRDGTAIIVKPTYSNVATVDVDNDAVLKIYSSADKFKGVFAEVQAENGVFVIDDSVIADHTLKYKAQLETVIGGTTVKSSMISLSVKMGTAKLTVVTEDATLFANDRNDRVSVRLELKDAALNKIDRVEIKDAKYRDAFEVIDYGNGEFAIGFKNGVPENLVGKTVTLNLNVFIEGNQTAKANATAKVKLTIVK